ncbi:glycosyl hydrolase family 88 [Sporanaerobium hydrogeniformans]|uniref:Glycosyl hydrolase family 88 n=1 Tax=Sporanaerobium hydrogeniformans TaxID=3072179 RepID=A0AC61D9H6_9FIRM|nr:glycoside hydrolase family 88 protein [Sporanaerobium hydrogeniformans]PHV69455.1 glycosyl hydrolase family 88 [Sporanaerobium hydrogeniformans]
MEMLKKYLEELIDKSTPERPIWNIEKIRSGEKPTWNYIDGCMIKAILEMYAITGEKKYLSFADAFISYHVQEDGTINAYHPEEYNIDNINAGKVLFELYDLTGKERYRKAIDTVYEQVKHQPRTSEGNFWHKKIYPNQVWLDGLYMGQPFYMEYETKFNDKKNYADICRQFANVEKLMKDPVTGLYYHGYDSSRQAKWCNKETGLSKNFWLRAIGWYVMALIDTLEKMDKSYEAEYSHLMSNFKEVMKAMLKFQDESGMWYQVIDQGTREGNYLETSGSAIMAYAILKGIRMGFLPEDYRCYGEKAFYGICDKYLYEKEGEMNLGGICLVAGLGVPDSRDGTFEYYISEPIVENEAKGVAPLLLAYTEILRTQK